MILAKYLTKEGLLPSEKTGAGELCSHVLPDDSAATERTQVSRLKALPAG